MGSEVLVSFFVSLVLGDAIPLSAFSSLTRLHTSDRTQHSQVQVLSSDDDGVGHFGRVNDTGQDTSSDRDLTGEGALLVDVGTVDGL